MITKIAIFFLKTSIILCFSSSHGVEGRKCNFNIRVEQFLHNEGFHRNFTTNVDFASDDESERWLYDDCMVGIEIMLPPGIYASNDEIKESKCEGLIDTIFVKPVNIELPAEMSEPIILQLLTKVTNFRAHVHIPVHARYHEAVVGGGTATNEIPSPKVHLLCPEGRLEKCDDLYNEISEVNSFCDNRHTRQQCNWKEVPIIMISPPLQWDVPVGNTNHYHVVAWSTGAIIILGTLYFMKTLHEYNIKSERENLKRSL